MKTTTIITAIGAFLATTGHGLATRQSVDTVLPEGYTLVDMSWELETSPGGAKVILNGTAEQVYHQLLEINPTYEEDFADIFAERERLLDNSLTARALIKRDWTVCGAEKTEMSAYQDFIKNGISYLRKLSGEARNGPGPRNCGRVSCSINSAIFFCNQNNFEKSMSWHHIAEASQVIVNECSFRLAGKVRVHGERWHDDLWFAWITHSSC